MNVVIIIPKGLVLSVPGYCLYINTLNKDLYAFLHTGL